MGVKMRRLEGCITLDEFVDPCVHCKKCDLRETSRCKGTVSSERLVETRRKNVGWKAF